jgi:hypothetical protein
MYQAIKKNKGQIDRRCLPCGFNLSDVLDDLLRNDPENRLEGRMALAKSLLRSFFF